VLLEAAPNLKNKQKLLDMMDKEQQASAPAAQQAQQLQFADAAAKVDETKSKTLKNLADAHAAGQPEAQPAPPVSEPKPPSESINFKDIPPEAQSQMLAQAGIVIHPAILAAHARQQAEQQTVQAARLAAIKTANRPQPQPA
jgi:hypothetical protein